MNSDEPSASIAPPREADANSQSRAIIEQAFRGFLDREPLASEVDFHIDLLADGISLFQLVEGIAQGPEAREARQNRLSGRVPSVPSGAVRPDERLSIRADDVFQTIAKAMNVAGDQDPAFARVMAEFDIFRNGDDLTSIVHRIVSAASGSVPLSAASGSVPLSAPLAASVEDRENVKRVVGFLYRDSLKREANGDELEAWYQEYTRAGQLSLIVLAILQSEEAEQVRGRNRTSSLPAGLFVQMAFEVILGRGASASDVDVFRERIEKSGLGVDEIILSFFNAEMSRLLKAPAPANNPHHAYLFGSRGVIESSEWETMPDRGIEATRRPGALGEGSLLRFDRDRGCAVSIITSLYKGGEYIEAFLKNITQQTIFRDYCELIIIDADSPDGEGAVIARFQERYPNIVYHRTDTRIGIYEAWNIAVRMAKGRYITNANLDDCRRKDSLEIQASILDSLPFADVAYQDVLYSFEPNISFEEIEAHDLRTNLPIVSRYNLMEFNSPHNGPMWRKSIHDDVGLFNEAYKSAADYDFWFRSSVKGKTFYKSNEAHVAYYVNPNGLSTRADTLGVVEANAISKTLFRSIVSPLLVLGDVEFLKAVNQIAPSVEGAGSRYDIVQAALLETGRASRCSASKGVK